MKRNGCGVFLLILACACSGFGQTEPTPAPAFVPFAPDEIFDISLWVTDPTRREAIERDLRTGARFRTASSARFDMAPEALATAATKDVLLHFIRSPQTAHMGIYSSPNMGIADVLYTSATLQEFFRRQDIPSAIIAAYRELDVDPLVGPVAAPPAERIGLTCTPDRIDQLSRLPYLDPDPPAPDKAVKMAYGRISLMLAALDKLVMYPPLFARLKASDEALLAVLHERLAKMVAVNDRMVRTTGDTAYSYSVGTAIALVLRLAERSAPALHTVLQEQVSRPGSDDHAFVETLGIYLGVP